MAREQAVNLLLAGSIPVAYPNPSAAVRRTQAGLQNQLCQFESGQRCHVLA